MKEIEEKKGDMKFRGRWDDIAHSPPPPSTCIVYSMYIQSSQSPNDWNPITHSLIVTLIRLTFRNGTEKKKKEGGSNRTNPSDRNRFVVEIDRNTHKTKLHAVPNVAWCPSVLTDFFGGVAPLSA